MAGLRDWARMLSMKIRNPWLIRAIGWTAARVVRLWVRTLRYEDQPLGQDVDPCQPNLSERYIYAFWHETMLLPACHYGRPDIAVLISQHADGELIPAVCRHRGFQLARGSTAGRGRVEAS